MNLNVREMERKDIASIAHYWSRSEPEFLVSMGVDISKLPLHEDFIQMLTVQVESPIAEKKSYALIWEVDGQTLGHSNINGITFGQSAHMHLHLWNVGTRRKGMGTELVKRSLPFYFRNFELQELYCEPYALNPAPHKTLVKVGFEEVKRYTTIPGSINFEQEVIQWRLSKERFEELSRT